MNEYILALDIGTSSVRAALYDMNGDVIPATFVKNERRLTATDDGGAEIDANKALAQMEEAIDDVLAKSADLYGNIVLAAASSFWHSLVGADSDGVPTTRVLAWGDTRSRDFVATLRAELDETAIHNRTGASFHSSFWPAKILWLKNESPDVFAKTALWLSFSDFVAMKFFHGGAYQPFTSLSMAAGTGIFDLRSNRWDAELLEFLAIDPDQLPQIPFEDSLTSVLNEDYAARWPRLGKTRWFPAIGDGAANNIGAGSLEKNEAALMIGTSGAMRVAYEGNVPERIPAGLWCYRIDRERVILGGALSDGGGLYRWLKDNLKLNGTDDEIEDEIAKRAPDSHGLTFLPFLAGERSTGYHENAFGAAIGLHAATDTIDIVQAALESVAYRFAEIYERLSGVCGIETIIASGGALRESPVWTQMISDVLAMPLSLPETREASSRGAVLLALETVGKIEDILKLKTPDGMRFEPNAERHEIYREARKRHQQFYELLIH